MRRFILLAVVVSLAVSACKKNEEEAAPAAIAPPKTEPAPAPAPPTPPPAPAVDMSNKAGNCPSTVAGARTAVVEDKAMKTSVVVTITADDAAATESIRKRAKHLVTVQGAPDATIEHTGEGTGGGAKGVCPVVTKDTKVTAKDVDKGVQIAMEPVAPLTLDALKADVAKRIASAETYRTDNVKPSDGAGGGGGVGGGKGDHGGNHSGEGDGKGKEREAAKRTEGAGK